MDCSRSKFCWNPSGSLEGLSAGQMMENISLSPAQSSAQFLLTPKPAKNTPLLAVFVGIFRNKIKSSQETHLIQHFHLGAQHQRFFFQLGGDLWDEWSSWWFFSSDQRNSRECTPPPRSLSKSPVRTLPRGLAEAWVYFFCHQELAMFDLAKVVLCKPRTGPTPGFQIATR